MTDLKDDVLNPPEEDEQPPELEEVMEAGGGIWGRPRMTPALNNLERVIHVTGLALQHPHDYNVNVMSWDNVDRLKLPKHTRCVRSTSNRSVRVYVELRLCLFGSLESQAASRPSTRNVVWCVCGASKTHIERERAGGEGGEKEA